MARQTVTAFFDDREQAEHAVLLLRRFGIPDRDVIVSPAAAATGYAEEMPAHTKDFWAWLDTLFGDTDHHAVYAEGVRRGDVMVSVHLDETGLDNVVAILERHGAMDLNARETAWRAEGWTGRSSDGSGKDTSLPGAATPLTPAEAAAAGVLTTASAGEAYRSLPGRSAATPARCEDASHVTGGPIAVGARKVSRGRVRIHARATGASFERQSNVQDGTATGSLGGTEVDVADDHDAGRASASITAAPSVQRAEGKEVVGSDGQHVGFIDRVEGTTIRLKPRDHGADASQYLIPTAWVHSIDDRVVLKLLAAAIVPRGRSDGNVDA